MGKGMMEDRMDEDWFSAYRREVYEDIFKQCDDPTMPEEMPEAVLDAMIAQWGIVGPAEVYAAIRAALMGREK